VRSCVATTAKLKILCIIGVYSVADLA
jgi:hypothetical protein